MTDSRFKVVVREAGADDLPAAGAIAAGSLDLDAEDASRIPGYLWEDGSSGKERFIASLDGADAGVLVGSVQGGRAFLDLIAVLPQARRRGVAAALLEAWEAAAWSGGAEDLRIGENLSAYAWPGADIRYTPAVCLFRRAGYVRTGIAYNMDLPLHRGLEPGDRQLRRLADASIAVRRGGPGDARSLAAHVERLWPEVWQREVLLALSRTPSSVFIATRGETVLGFAAHGVYRPSLYGPIAVDPREQGHGVGEVLSRLCLADMLAHGIQTAQIGWVAEDAVPFYARTVGARLGRCFWMMRKAPSQ